MKNTSIQSTATTELSGKNRNTASDKTRKKTTGHIDIEADLCKGCLLCLEVCPTDVLVESSSLNCMGYRPAQYLGEGCTGCGVCYYICPEPGAIRVTKNLN